MEVTQSILVSFTPDELELLTNWYTYKDHEGMTNIDDDRLYNKLNEVIKCEVHKPQP